MEIKEREMEEVVAARAKVKAERVRAKEWKRSGAATRTVPTRKTKVCPEWPFGIDFYLLT